MAGERPTGQRGAGAADVPPHRRRCLDQPAHDVHERPPWISRSSSRAVRDRVDVAAGEAAPGVDDGVDGSGRGERGGQPAPPSPRARVPHPRLHEPAAPCGRVARSPAGVGQRHGADEDRRDAVLAQPALEVDLLGVHEEGLVEPADRAERLGRVAAAPPRPPSRPAGRPPVPRGCRGRPPRAARRRSRNRASGVSHSTVWWPTVGKCRALFDGRPSVSRRRGPTTAGIHGAAAATQVVDEGRGQGDVAVEYEEQGLGGQGRAGVHGGAEATVGLSPNDGDAVGIRERLGGAVVDHHDLHRAVGRLTEQVADRRQCGGGVTVVGDDDRDPASVDPLVTHGDRLTGPGAALRRTGRLLGANPRGQVGCDTRDAHSARCASVSAPTLGRWLIHRSGSSTPGMAG